MSVESKAVLAKRAIELGHHKTIEGYCEANYSQATCKWLVPDIKKYFEQHGWQEEDWEEDD